MTALSPSARVAPDARGAGVLTRELDARNLSRGDVRVIASTCSASPVKLRPAFGSGGFSEVTEFAPGGAGRAVTITVAHAVGAARLMGYFTRAAGNGMTSPLKRAVASQPGGAVPVPPGTQSAHVGQIGTAEAGRNTPPATGGFRGGNTAPHAPGALTECATSENAAGGDSAKTKTTEQIND